jgi:uncharacterized membrane protein YbhN (UPF0104 family)
MKIFSSIFARARSSKSQWWTIAVVLVITLFMFLAVVRDWDNIQTFDWHLNWFYLFLSVLFYVATLWLLFLSWYSIMKCLVGPGDIATHLNAYAVSFLAKRIPLPIWFVGSRLLLYEQIPKKIVAAATILEAIFIAFSGILLYLVLIPYATFIPSLSWQILTVIAGLLLLSVMLRPNWPIDITNKLLILFKKSPIEVKVTRKNTMIWLLIFSAGWVANSISFYFLTSAVFPTDPGWLNITVVSLIYGLVAFVGLVLPAGFGLKELSASALLTNWVPFSVGLLIALAFRIMNTLLETAWALLAARLVKKSAK